MSTLAVAEGPRACHLDELTGMIALADSVMRQGSTQSFLTDYPLVYTPENLSNIQIIKVDDLVVSVVPFIPKQISFADTQFRIGIISPTATHPEHRRRGHAARCLDACLATMEQDGMALSVLWTLPTTFPFYEMAGYQAVPSQMNWAHCVREDAANFRPRPFEIAKVEAEDLASLKAIARIHGASPCGVVRSERDTQALFSLPRTATWIARDSSGEVRAYLLHCAGTHKPGILEAEGDPDAVESLVHYVLSGSGEGRTPVYLSKTTSALSVLFHERLPERVEAMEAGPMMIRINDPAGFLEAIYPWLTEHVGGEKRSFSLEIEDACQVVGFDFDPGRGERLILTRERAEAHYATSRRELTSQLFGARDGLDSTIASLLGLSAPFFFPIPMLDHS